MVLRSKNDAVAEDTMAVVVNVDRTVMVLTFAVGRVPEVVEKRKRCSLRKLSQLTGEPHHVERTLYHGFDSFQLEGVRA